MDVIQVYLNWLSLSVSFLDLLLDSGTSSGLITVMLCLILLYVLVSLMTSSFWHVNTETVLPHSSREICNTKAACVDLAVCWNLLYLDNQEDISLQKIKATVNSTTVKTHAWCLTLFWSLINIFLELVARRNKTILCAVERLCSFILMTQSHCYVCGLLRVFVFVDISQKILNSLRIYLAFGSFF